VTAAPTTEPTAAPPSLLEQTNFVLAGETEPLTLQTDAAQAAAVPATLHPLLDGEKVMAPFLEILRDAGSVILPGTDTVLWEVAFTLNEDLYQLTYTQDEANNVADLIVLKNQAQQAVTDGTGYVLDGVLYLPIGTITEATGVTFALDEAAERYTVTLAPTES
jgi:hypothetical protein